MKKKMLLVDGNALYFKAFWASYIRIKDGRGPRLADGTPVNALQTFAMMIMKLRTQFDADKMLVAFDERGGHTHRHHYAFYKANRSKQPDELYIQLPFVWDFLDKYGVKHYRNKKVEADDVIGIMAERGKNQGFEVDIITTDKDLLQLVDKDVHVHISKVGVSKMEKYTTNNFQVKYMGLQPYQVVEFKGIAGDSSDNLEGVKGIGEKGAIKLLLEHHTLEGVYENIEGFTPKMKEKLEIGRDMAKICWELAHILREGNIEIDVDDIDLKTPDYDKLEQFFAHIPIYNVPRKLREERGTVEEDSIESLFEELKF